MAEPQMAMAFGAVSDMEDAAGIATVRQQTHDQVLEMAGGRRLSGVTWTEFPAHDEASRTWVEKHLHGAQGLLDFLAENPFGLLIVAACEWDPPKGGADVDE